jgi:hypothetical protein
LDLLYKRSGTACWRVFDKVFPISRDFDQGGPFIGFTVTRVGDQRAYELKIDTEARSCFAVGKFFTSLANLDYEEGDKGEAIPYSPSGSAPPSSA